MYESEKSLLEYKSKLDEATVKEVEGALAAAKAAAGKEDGDAESIKTAVTDLRNATMKIGAAINKAGNSSGSSGSSGSSEEGKTEEAQEATKADDKEKK